MTTSGNVAFNQNRNDIIKAALRKIGAIKAGETVNADIISDAAVSLNAMVKEWNAIGIHLWTETEATLFLQPHQVKYSLGPTSTDHATETYVATALSANVLMGSTNIPVDSITDILNGDKIAVLLDDGTLHWTTVNGVPAGSIVVITDALPDSATITNPVYAYTTRLVRPLRVPFARRFQFIDNIDTPMIRMARADYRDLPNKTNTGTITQFFYDPQTIAGLGYLYVWPAPPDVQSALKFTFYRPIQDFDTAANTPDFPQEWISTLIFNLAVELAPEYGCPTDVFQQIQALAAEKLDRLTGWDREPESTNMGVDFTQMGYGN